ncbi:MAG: NAD(P)-dependent glycerol-3-phosphate dehydrogenase [Clostridia bacterium]|nr:NAD(P)-dependent glycerol-3-phosphate dehydrogenase [Clostridia bacterium]
MKKVAIIGSGSWGVALAVHLAKLGNEIKIWSFMQEEADLINKERKCKFLPGIEISENIMCTTSYKEALEDTDFVLHVTPSKFTRNILKEYKQYLKDQPVIICSKGFEEETLNTLDEVFKQEVPNTKIGVLTGPSHAEEVALFMPTLLVVASKYEEISNTIQNTFMCDTMRVYTSTDVKGVEIGGALKNIIAFCAGAAAGIGLKDNSFAALVTRGMAEIVRLGVKLGGQYETFYGLSGLGDLIVTCMSEHSRNRKAGKLIGQGVSLEEAKKQVEMTIESIDNIDVAYKLSKIHDVEMPIVTTVYDVLYNNLKPEEALKILMTRTKKSE